MGNLQILADRARLERLSDGLAAGIAVSLPWSTTLTAVLVVLWLVSLLPIHDFAGLGRILKTPAGAMPVALVVLTVLGTLWADIPWIDRLHGINALVKLLAIPLLMVRFSSSPRAHWVLNGLLASVTLLLVVSTLHAAWPGMPFFSRYQPGVPVNDYITQSSLFTIAIFVFLEMAALAWKEGRFPLGVALGLLACGFLANILSIVTGRTALLVIPVLLILFCLRQATVKGAVGICIVGALLAGVAWSASPYLRARVATITDEVTRYRTEGEFTSAGFRLEFWKNAVRMVEASPVIGHGTGSIREMYRRAIENGQSALHEPTPNPHNQAIAIAIQLGLAGVAVLLAMWLVHGLHFFRSDGLLGWAGLVVVVQNVIGSMFNSHLSDFSSGWLYAIMVGVLAGAVMRSPTAAR